ncbi:11113_t:CDS:2, partial [Racocetra fulgida]
MGACLCKPKLRQKRQRRRKLHRRVPASSISSPLSDAHLIMSDTFDCGVNEEYRFIDGRRFHNVRNSKYMMPCDDDELDRLHVLHYICRFIWKCNYSAPIHDKLSSGGALVLDVGCGTGTWVVEMANEFPRSHFTGIDISPVFPREAKPENVLFAEANLLDAEEISTSFGKWAANIFRTFRTKFSSFLGLEPDEYDKLLEAWCCELNDCKPYN